MDCNSVQGKLIPVCLCRGHEFPFAGSWRKSPEQPVRRAWRREWDEVDPEEAETSSPHGGDAGEGDAGTHTARPFIPEEAVTELAQHGITLPVRSTTSLAEVDADGVEEAQAVLEAWERAWKRIKKELAPRVCTTVRKGDAQFRR